MLVTSRSLVLSALALAAVAMPALAQESGDGSIDPRPKYCTTEPVALDALLALAEAAATPSADADAGPLAGKTQIVTADIPTGAAADEETAKAIQDTELIYASCYNKGDFLRAAALLSPRGQGSLAQAASDPAIAARFATPEPFKKDQRIPGIAVENIQTFEDGTAAAVVTWAPGDPRQEVNLHLYVKGDDGLWYIDREIEITDVVAPAAATPVADGAEAAATPSS